MNITYTLNNIFLAIIVIIIAFILIRLITYVFNKIDKLNFNMTLIYLTRDIMQYSLVFIAIVIVLDIFGINLTGIFVSLGIAGIALGFASKDIISNFMSGIILISDKNIKVGDTIEINKHKGIIKKISFRSTRIENEDGVLITVPNSTLSTNPYLKFKPYERNKISLLFTIPNSIDLKEFEEELLKILKKDDKILKIPKPHLESKGIGENGMEIKFICVVEQFQYKRILELKITNESSKIISEMIK